MGLEKNSRLKGAQVCAVLGWVISWEDGHPGKAWASRDGSEEGAGVENNSSVMDAQAWVVQEWVRRTPRQGCPGLRGPGMSDFLDGKKRILVPADHQFWVFNTVTIISVVYVKKKRSLIQLFLSSDLTSEGEECGDVSMNVFR